MLGAAAAYVYVVPLVINVLQGFLTGASGGTLTEQRKAYIARALQDAPVGPTSAFNYSNTGLLIAAVVAVMVVVFLWHRWRTVKAERAGGSTGRGRHARR